jgi:hypothetical protein
MENERKQMNDPKDDVNPKFVPEGGDCLAEVLDDMTKKENDPSEDVVGSLQNTHVPFKVK